MVHLGVKKTTQDVNINVKPISNINITTTGQPTATSPQSVAPGSVIYPDAVPDAVPDALHDALHDSNPYTIDEVEQLKNQVDLLTSPLTFLKELRGPRKQETRMPQFVISGGALFR